MKLFKLAGSLAIAAAALVLPVASAIAQDTPVTPDAPAAEAQAAYAGVELAELDDATRALLELDGGCLVQGVAADSPAAVAGVEEFDIIVSVDGKAVNTPAEFDAVLAAYAPGDTIVLGVLRAGENVDVKLTLGADDKLRRSLEEAFEEGDSLEDPQLDEGGMNPFGDGGGDMMQRMQDMFRRMMEGQGGGDGEGGGDMMQRLQEMLRGLMGGEGDGNGEGDGSNPLRDLLRRFGQGQGNTPEQPQPVEPREVPWLGFAAKTVSEDLQSLGITGVEVTRVEDSSPADEAGLLPGDIITSFNGVEIAERNDLREVLNGLEIGQVVEIVLIRDGEETKIELTVGSQVVEER